MTYADVSDVEAGFRDLSGEEQARCFCLLAEAATIIDACSPNAGNEAKQLVSCRMVRRVLGDGQSSAALYPLGATQGSASALGYSQNWTMSGGSAGELYISKLEKRLLGIGSRIGVHSPLEDMTC